jgi:hypothetical protein
MDQKIEALSTEDLARVEEQRTWVLNHYGRARTWPPAPGRHARESGHLLGCRGHHALALLDASSSEDARFRGHDGLFAGMTACSRA